MHNCDSLSPVSYCLTYYTLLVREICFIREKLRVNVVAIWRFWSIDFALGVGKCQGWRVATDRIRYCWHGSRLGIPGDLIEVVPVDAIDKAMRKAMAAVGD